PDANRWSTRRCGRDCRRIYLHRPEGRLWALKRAESSGFGPIFVANAQRLTDFDRTSPKQGANHGIVTVFGERPISEFLIVGCQHGWLYPISYDRGENRINRDSHGCTA